MTPAAYAAYTNVAMNTTSKEKILLMLYEGALRFVGHARTGIEEKRVAFKGENISKALAILTELDCALDHEVGGEISENLAGLYQYMMKRMTDANINNDTTALDEVEKLLTTLKDAFEEAAHRTKATMPLHHGAAHPTTEGRVDFAV